MTNNKFQISGLIIVALIAGSIGGILFDRALIPQLSQVAGFGWLTNYAANAPIVITRNEQVVLNEGANFIELAKQVGNSTVSFYETDSTPSFLGNGIIMSSDGLIFTTKAVVKGQSQVTVVLNDGTKHTGLVRAMDPHTSLVAVTLHSAPVKNLSTVSFGEALKLQTGQKILAVGESNREFARSFSVGHVTNAAANTAVLNRTYSTEVLEDSFETDAAAAASSRFLGGPIINLEGKLVGMISGSQKIIITENIQTALSSYLASGKIVRPVMGLTYQRISKGASALQGLDRTGVLVSKVDAGGPAAGKLLANDLIFEVDGQNLENESFEQLISRHSIGDVRLKLLRAGNEIEVTVALRETK